MNQKCPKSRKNESEIKNTPGTICTTLRILKYRGVTCSSQKCDFLNYSIKEWIYTGSVYRILLTEIKIVWYSWGAIEVNLIKFKV